MIKMIDEDEVPNNWEIKTIDEVCSVNGNYTYPEDEFPEEEFQYISVSEVDGDSGRITDSQQVFGKEASTRARRKISENDVLVSTVRPYLRAFAIVPKELDGAIASTAFAVLTAEDDIIPKYLHRFVRSPLFTRQLEAKQKGASYPEVRLSEVKESNILVPPLDEQKAIVSSLDEQLDQIDRLDKSVKQVSHLTNEYESSLLAFLFAGRQDMETGDVNNAPTEDSIPEHWELKIVDDVIKGAKNGGTPKRSQDEYWEGSIDWLSSGEVQGKEVYTADESITQKGLDETSAKIFPKDSILIAMYGATRGQSTILKEEMSGNQAICCLEIDESEVLLDFLLYYFKHIKQKMVSEGRGGGQKNINQSVILNQKVPVPPLDEQEEIVAKIENIDLNRVQKAVNDVDELFDEYRESVLTQAFMKSPDEDENDEPNPKLLSDV